MTLFTGVSLCGIRSGKASNILFLLVLSFSSLSRHAALWNPVGLLQFVTDALAESRLGIFADESEVAPGIRFFLLLCCFCGVLGHLVWVEGMYALQLLGICGCCYRQRAFKRKKTKRVAKDSAKKC